MAFTKTNLLLFSSFGAFIELGSQFSNANTTASPRSSTLRNSLSGLPVPQHLTEGNDLIEAS